MSNSKPMPKPVKPRGGESTRYDGEKGYRPTSRPGSPAPCPPVGGPTPKK